MTQRVVVGWTCAVFALTSSALCQPTASSIKVGDVPPPLSLTAVWQAPEGSRADWESLRGKVIVLEFWATWCGGCVAAFPHMNGLVDEFKGEPVTFISITDEKNEDYVRKFLTKRPLTTWVGIDGERKLFKALNITGIPRTIIVDKNGKLAGDTYPTELTPAILREILAGKTPNWPKSTARQLEELDPAGGPAALFEMWFKPAADAPGGQMSMGPREVAWRGLPLKMMIGAAYAVSDARVIDEAPEITEKRCEFFLRLPRANSGALRRLWQLAIESTFDLSISREHRDHEVYVLKLPVGGKHRLKASEFENAVPPSKYAPDLLSGDGVTLTNIATAMEAKLRTPVLDETGLKGRWDYELHFSDTRLPGFAAVVREQLGLELVADRRSLEVLVIKSSVPPSSQPAGASD